MPTVLPPKRVYRTFPKIGREVHFLPTGENNPRNGEGAFIRLKSGEILYAYSAYFGDDYHDECSANINGILSADEGETWSAPRVLLTCPPGPGNYMSVSLLRMQGGDIGLFFVNTVPYKDITMCRYKFSRSADEGVSWSAPEDCIEDVNNYVVLNDATVRISDGSLIIPSSLHDCVDRVGFGAGQVCFFRSADDGRSFERLPGRLCSPVPGDTDGFAEPGVLELPDGRLWAWARTTLGFQYSAYSEDGGKSWTDPVPDRRFTSPQAPMRVKKVGKYTVAVFNPVPEHAANPAPFGMDRTPLMLSVSDDGGLTFTRSYLLEDDPRCAFCYPSFIECSGGMLVAYYHSNNTGKYLNCAKITKVSFDEIQ